MKRTLFRRVFPLYLAAVAASLGMLSLITTTQLARTVRRQTAAELSSIARHIVSTPGSRDLPWVLAFISDSPFVDAAGVIDGDGRPLPGLEPSGTYFTSIANIQSVAAEARRSGNPQTGSGRGADSDRWFAWSVAPLTEGRYLVVSRAAPRIGARAAPAIGGIVALTVLLVAAIAVLLYRSLKWIDDPIKNVQNAARDLARGQLDVTVRASGPPELQALAADIDDMATQLRHRIQSISTQRNQLEAILTSMLEGVIVLDPSRQIVSMNEAAGRLLEVDADAALGRTLIEFLRNAQLDELAESAFVGGSSVERTITLYRDRPIHLQVHSTPLVTDGSERLGSLMVINDITRLVQLETLRRDFVANVSHELKTPITSIQGFVETLVDGPLTDAAQTRRYLGIITKHTNRLNAIIEDLLSLSRLEHTDQSITFRAFSLEELRDAVDNTVHGKAEKKEIALSWRIGGRTEAWGNPNLLEQALVNLIDNAIKYSPERSPVSAELMNEEDRLVLSVSDGGQGIPARDLPRVFERFYRTDKARSRELGGTGLGLAIVKHIARAHRGTVSASSVFGEGSTFIMEIPQNRRDAASVTTGTQDVT